jgi:glycerol-3-phosphate dehydrogenase (NAD+)
MMKLGVAADRGVIGGATKRHCLAAARSVTAGVNSNRHKVPPCQVPQLWAQAQAVCFDVDCTITKQDGLDDLAEFLGKGEEVRQLTNAAMNGDMDLDTALQKRLDIMEPTVDKLTAYIQSNPALPRLVPGIQDLIKELQARKVEVFLISGGFRELILPLADVLGIPRGNIYANRFVYVADDNLDDHEYFPKIRVKGLDPSQPTSREGGKAEAIRQIRAKKPLQTVVMVGDGITDLEAVQETGRADLFVGYGGVVKRTNVQERADWFVTDYQDLIDMLPRIKVAMVGSGAFASATMQMISQNTKAKAMFEDRVDMYVYEEEFQGAHLSDMINQQHENPKYLPGVHFGDNVVANPSLEDTVKDADVIVLCAPHQFMHSLCKQMQLVVKPSAIAISLTKGIRIAPEGPQLMSHMIRRMLRIPCSVMMGANIAGEIGPGGLCESTIGSHHLEGQGEVFEELFQTDYFTTSIITDIEGAEMAGALKNVVAIAAGLADGCDLGQNAKATILRQGLFEMRQFAKAMYPTVRDETFFESCGVADLIATCYGGRNHRVAEQSAKDSSQTSFEELEAQMLNGQNLQGVLTSDEVQSVLDKRSWQAEYPLFTAVNAIANGMASPKEIVHFRDVATRYTKLKQMGADDASERQSLLERRAGV